MNEDAAAADLLRRMVEGFSSDIEAVQLGVVDGRTPDAARAILAAALRYVVLDVDLVPDHLEGVGLIDDAAMLRLGAAKAIAGGASDPAVARLAAEAGELGLVFGELVAPLGAFLDGLLSPDAEGRTPTDVIAEPKSRIELWRALAAKRDSSRKHALVASVLDTGNLVKTLRTIVRARLVKLGLIT